MRKNERKIQALEAFKGGKQPYSARDLANRIGISKNAAHNLLRRLWIQGLARRFSFGEELNYRITEKGKKRLSYLKRQRIKQKLMFWKK